MIQSIVQAIAEHAKQDPDKLCIADHKRSASYEEYFSFIYGYALHLKEQGLKKGDAVVVQTMQSMEFTVCGLAIQLLGAIFVPVEKKISKIRFIEIMEETEAVLHIGREPVRENVLFNNILEALNFKQNYTGKEQIIYPEKEDTAEILFTTGTTGKSKGIELTHGSVIAVAENIINGVSMEKDNIELIPVPLSHSHGLRRYYGNMLNGSSVVLADGVIFIHKIFQLIDKYNVTAIDLVPAALSALFQLSGDTLGNYKNQISYVQIGSAAIGESEILKIKELLPNTRLYNFYGSTEAGCSCILNFSQEQKGRLCVGKATKNAEFIFVNENGKIINATKENPGYLACKGTMNMKCYYHDMDLTREIMRDGYIYSNDLAYMDRDGYIYVLGRKGDVIESGGHKIAPEEIEDIVLKIPGIKDCACVPISDSILKNVPKLYYVKETNFQDNTIQIRDSFDAEKDVFQQEIWHCLSEGLESYKIPKIIEEIKVIPRTYNGKLKRNELKEKKGISEK